MKSQTEGAKGAIFKPFFLHNKRPNGALGAYKTRVLKSGSISQKWHGRLDLCALNVPKLRLRILITWFQCRFDFGR